MTSKLLGVPGDRLGIVGVEAGVGAPQGYKRIDLSRRVPGERRQKNLPRRLRPNEEA